MSYCPSYGGSYPSISCGPCCPPPYPPCPPQSHCSSICGISKLASFVHYGGNSGNCCGAPPPPKRDQCCQPKQQRPQQQRQSQNCGGPIRRCPPIPPCAATCMTQGQDCKDLPAQRLRNVDVLEELCYYVPGGDPSCQMDCYSVDECGNVEKIGEGGGGDGCCDPCNNNSDPCGCPPNPVKYSRRQRFTFNDPKGGRPSYGDPWPFEGNCGDGGGGGNGYYPGRNFNNGNNRGNGNGPRTNNGPPENLCCSSRANGNNGNGNNGRQYTYCPEGTVDCGDMLPPESGVYYYDRERRAFVPERELPKAPEVIEKRITVPDVEEYEILEEEDGTEGGGGGGGGRDYPPPQRQTIQPVVQPIIMSTTSNPPPCNPPPPQIIPYPIPTPYNPCPCPPPCCPPPPPPPQPPPPPPCNPCGNSCSPCCNPCGNSCGPCQPCAPMCNPCYNPCYNQCNPCMPCGPMNPFMNMCGGVLPMVIPMCPQQPSGGGGGGYPPPGAMPPPPFPFPPPFFKEKKKKKRKRESRSESRYYPQESGTQYSDNIIVPGAPEDMLEEMGEDIPPEAEAVAVGSDIEVEEALPPLQEQEQGNAEAPLPPRRSKPRSDAGPAAGGGRNVQRLDDGTIITTIDFPPGEAEIVDVTATARRNPYEPNIDVVAELQGGKADPGPPGKMLSPDVQYTTQDGATVTSYTLPEGKDGYVKATSNTDLQ